MSEPSNVSPPAPGASAIADAPLTDPAVAVQRMADLTADPKFMERVAQKDAAAFDEYNKAWRVAHGLPETPQPPQSAVEVDVERDARTIAAVQQHAGHYADQGWSEEEQIEAVGQRPVTLEEKRWFQARYDEHKSDPEFMRRWTAGGLKEIRMMQRLAVLTRGLPSGTPEDVKRWEGE